MPLVTQKYLKTILSYNPDTGIFKWIKKRQGIRKDMIANAFDGNNYITLCIDGHFYKGHRLAWFYVYGIWPKKFLDHINNIRSDNRIINLREAEGKENAWNANRRKDNTSGFKGVDFHKMGRKFQARIRVNGKRITIGLFKTAKEAHEAYCKKGRELHGEFFNKGIAMTSFLLFCIFVVLILK